MNDKRQLFSFTEKRLLRGTYTHIRIDDSLYEAGTSFTAEINRPYSLTILCGYSNARNTLEEKLIFSAGSFHPDYIHENKITLGTDEFAKVSLTFTRVLNFWEVVFY